jgi:hypothetical protein
VTGRTQNTSMYLKNGRKYRSAIAKACKMTQNEVVDYTVAPVFMIDKEKGAHEWMIEFKRLQNAFTLSEI